MQSIRKYFEQYVLLSDKDWQVFSSKLSKKVLPRKTLLLTMGEIENNLSFIEKGIVRHFIPREENDLTFAFAFANGFVSAYDSFVSRRPSNYQLETLTDTILW